MTTNTNDTKATENENLLQHEHWVMLGAIAEFCDHHRKPIERDEIDLEGFGMQLAVNLREDRANWRGGYSRVLNELVRWGFLKRLKAPSVALSSRPGYRPTAKVRGLSGRSADMLCSPMMWASFVSNRGAKDLPSVAHE